MIHADLLQELRSSLPQFPSLRELDAQTADELVERIAGRYISDPDMIWWWGSLSKPSTTIDYGEAVSLDIIRRLLPGDADALLIVTDDVAPPWPVFAGKLKSLLEYLGEQAHLEYILTDPDLSWLLFDTHHNTLVLLGSLAQTEQTSAI